MFIQTGSSANSCLTTLVQGLTGLVDAVGKIPGPILLAAGGLTTLALTVPKGILQFREYKSNLDAAGPDPRQSLRSKAPRTAGVRFVALQGRQGSRRCCRGVGA